MLLVTRLLYVTNKINVTTQNCAYSLSINFLFYRIIIMTSK